MEREINSFAQTIGRKSFRTLLKITQGWQNICPRVEIFATFEALLAISPEQIVIKASKCIGFKLIVVEVRGRAPWNEKSFAQITGR